MPLFSFIIIIYSCVSVPPGESACVSNPCQNDGYCTSPAGTGFVCQCPFGYVGMFCENGKSLNLELI